MCGVSRKYLFLKVKFPRAAFVSSSGCPRTAGISCEVGPTYGCGDIMVPRVDVRPCRGNVVVYSVCGVHLRAVGVSICSLWPLPMPLQSRVEHTDIGNYKPILVVGTRATALDT